ncbi:MAG: hypothetical protein NT045_06835 [Candidatus Aureabacteria bacterium]|nr:hypothetical protein [Candidatus Auribacterota bacterium]
MNWTPWRRREFIAVHIKAIDARISTLQGEIKRLDRFIEHPRPTRRREEVTIARLLGPTVLPESKKRFVSYLSTGSFQTIGLRRHEQRAAKIKAAIIVLLVIGVAFFLLYTFLVPFLW